MTAGEGVLLTWIFWILAISVVTVAGLWLLLVRQRRKVAQRDAEHLAARERLTDEQ